MNDPRWFNVRTHFSISTKWRNKSNWTETLWVHGMRYTRWNRSNWKITSNWSNFTFEFDSKPIKSSESEMIANNKLKQSFLLIAHDSHFNIQYWINISFYSDESIPFRFRFHDWKWIRCADMRICYLGNNFVRFIFLIPAVVRIKVFEFFFHIFFHSTFRFLTKYYYCLETRL